MRDIQVLRSLALGLVAIRTDGDDSLWDVGKLRKARKCADCEKQLAPGDQAYKPVTNKNYRYIRVCVPCVQAGLRKVNGL